MDNLKSEFRMEKTFSVSFSDVSLNRKVIGERSSIAKQLNDKFVRLTALS